MSSKPLPATAAAGKAGFMNSSSSQFQPLLYSSIYNMGSSGNEEFNLASAAAAPNFYTRNMKSLEEEEEEEEEVEEEADYGLAKAGGAVGALNMAAHARLIGGEANDGGIRVMKRWGAYEQEKDGYGMSPLMDFAGAAAPQSENGNLLGASSSCSAGDYLPLSNRASTHTAYSLDAAEFRSSSSHKYSPQDMEILRVKQPLNTINGSVQQLFYDHIPSSLGFSASLYHTHTHTHPPPPAQPPPSSSFSDHHHLHLDHPPPHQWSSSSLPSGGSHPHAELLLLPGVSDTASPLQTHSAALPSSQLDLLHASSLHDKQSPLQQLPLGVGSAPTCGASAGTGGHLPSAAASQMWNQLDKLDMAVGLGLCDHASATHSAGMFAQDADHFASARHVHTQSGLSLFLQSPHQRAQTALSLDAARYNSRTATGSVGVLRNSKYLKAAQQLLNEFCNVCRDITPDVKGSCMQASTAASSLAKHNIWTGTSAAEDNNINNIAGDDHGDLLHRCLFSGTQKDMSVLYPSEHSYKGSIEQSFTSSKYMKQAGDHHQEKAHADGGAAATAHRPPSPSHLNNPPPPKQLPADERCHLQMRKARLIAMVEELDRRYQQYRDQMQLIITSFESATGMGAAAAYTTLAKKAMSRQFRGLRDAISEHITKVCKLLGEEISSVPILSRGETPRLRLVDQRLRHQRSLQQIGMLPQQQAWRPQRGLPERSVTVLRAWLFEHFLHPYPKDSEKSMLARLTGLSRNQVSNWFINARVRLWKPMVEEMYVEESKALELSEDEGSQAAEDVMQGISPSDQGQSDRSSSRQSWQQAVDSSSRQSWQQQPSAPTPAPARAHASSFNNPEAVSLYHTRSDMNSFMHLHSSAHGHDPHSAHVHGGHVDAAEHQYSWMKGMQEEHAGDIGLLAHQQDHLGLQAAALMQGQLNASSAFMKNGVSLTLGLQQPPPHSSYNNTTSSVYGRPSEALLF